MRLSLLWIFSILLTTGEALLMCGSRDYRSCDQYSNDSEEAYRCLKTLPLFYNICNVSDILCTRTEFTFGDNFTFKQQGCVSVERDCQFTVEMHDKISILTNRSLDGNVTCTLCNVSGCNSIQELGDDIGCYYVNKDRCLSNFRHLIRSQIIGRAQYQTLQCLMNSYPSMCGHTEPDKEHFCLAKTFTFDDGERLVVKSCVARRDQCSWEHEEVVMQNTIGKNVTSSACEYCQTDFCNNQTVFFKPDKAVRCYYLDFQECMGDDAEKHQNETYDCVKNAKPIKRKCEEGCMTILLTVEDKTILPILMCREPNLPCRLDDNGEKIGSAIGKKIINHTCRNCTKDWCNNETTILPPGPKPLTCYHSNLESCISIVSVMPDFDAVLTCLTDEMNRNIRTRTCDFGLKCTTIVFTMESYGKVIEYATCGAGPKSKCEKDAYEAHFDVFVGQRIKHIECKYCETDNCNNVTTPLEGSRSLNSKGDIMCHVNKVDSCEKIRSRKEAHWDEKLENRQKKVFKCLKHSSLAIQKCQICLTVKYIFDYKEELVLKMCGDKDVMKNYLDNSGSRSCDLKKNQNWFWEYTGKNLISIKCNPCDTDLCNAREKKVKKAQKVSSNEARELMPNAAVFVLTIIFLF